MFEIEYVIPFHILFCSDFRSDWEADIADFSKEMDNLCNLLNIAINSNELAREYTNLVRGEGNLHVFFNKTKDIFILIDLYLSHTDQHNMINLGIHVPSHLEESAKKAMLVIYNDEDAIPKSDFIEYCNNKLLTYINKSNYPKKREFYYQDIIYHY